MKPNTGRQIFMQKTIMIGFAFVTIGLGAASCSATSSLLGCSNPTGYCGRSSTPNPERIGGPSWFLWDANAEERLAYYHDNCSRNDRLTSAQDVMSCAINDIKLDAHQYCVLYNLPPTRPKDAAEEAERSSNYERCKQSVLAQHNW
jgi:hypothetical protein